MGELHVRSRGQSQGEITYVVHPLVCGQGVGAAIGIELLARGFEELNLPPISATCDPSNLGPVRGAQQARHDTGVAASSYRVDSGWLARLWEVQHPQG
ncbi:GNAT family N-acetyltransferase [Streptomyces sp. NPDC059479]|uniref:GNAT family N-acetyltransferase n=1 Tax=Streptomyces sp. NPDC059479 TaxID=3346848 RepID=UPI00368B737D